MWEIHPAPVGATYSQMSMNILSGMMESLCTTVLGQLRAWDIVGATPKVASLFRGDPCILCGCALVQWVLGRHPSFRQGSALPVLVHSLLCSHCYPPPLSLLLQPTAQLCPSPSPNPHPLVPCSALLLSFPTSTRQPRQEG